MSMKGIAADSAKLMAFWAKVPVPVQTWLKGLEVFVLAGVVSSLVALPTANFSSWAGIAKFAGIIAAAAAGCVRLYLIKSPLTQVIQEVVASRTVSLPEGTVQDVVSEKLTK